MMKHPQCFAPVSGAWLVSLLVVGALTLPGCASVKGSIDPRDPMERFNRGTFKVNDALDRGVAKPAARAYRAVTPKFVRTGISNVLSNAAYPTVILNDLLQAKFKPAARDTGRLILNSTLGLAGLLDPATASGLEKNDEDFGQTLGRWGIPAGAYLVLPLLGPSSSRDAFGKVFDKGTEATTYIGSSSTKYIVTAVSLLDKRTGLLDTDALLERSGDKYALIRSAYLQRREYQVRDGEGSDAPPEEMEDPGDSPPPDEPKQP